MGRRDVETIAPLIPSGRDDQDALPVTLIQHVPQDGMCDPGGTEFPAANVDNVGAVIDCCPDRMSQLILRATQDRAVCRVAKDWNQQTPAARSYSPNAALMLREDDAGYMRSVI